jgi:hypothetical protein
VYTSVAEQLHKGTLTGISAVIQALSSLYPDDSTFYNAFSDKQIKTTQKHGKDIVRYVLFKLEKRESSADYSITSDKYNIEHILPESLGNEWDQFSDTVHEQFVYRLGNMTLMNSTDNRLVGNMEFPDKKGTYAKSEFLITQKIAEENSEWTPEHIANRQKWMAKQAKTIWRISQLA